MYELVLKGCLLQNSEIFFFADGFLSIAPNLWHLRQEKFDDDQNGQGNVKIPFAFKEFRYFILFVCILFNLAWFVQEMVESNVMAILSGARFLATLLQLIFHYWVCCNYQKLYIEKNFRGYIWCAFMLAIMWLLILSVFTDPDPIIKYGRITDTVVVGICLIWGVMQPGGIATTRWRLALYAFGLASLKMLIIVIIRPLIDYVINAFLRFAFVVTIFIFRRRGMRYDSIVVENVLQYQKADKHPDISNAQDVETANVNLVSLSESKSPRTVGRCVVVPVLQLPPENNHNPINAGLTREHNSESDDDDVKSMNSHKLPAKPQTATTDMPPGTVTTSRPLTLKPSLSERRHLSVKALSRNSITPNEVQSILDKVPLSPLQQTLHVVIRDAYDQKCSYEVFVDKVITLCFEVSFWYALVNTTEAFVLLGWPHLEWCSGFALNHPKNTAQAFMNVIA